MSKQTEVVPFSPEYAPTFAALNRRWIEQFFTLEEPDRIALEDPYGTIITPGGQIFFAVAEGRPMGTCAVIRESETVFELAKMAVDPEAQGRGYGNLLIQAALDFARQAGARKVILLSNSKLTPALSLYAKHGFRHVPVDDSHGYVRADVRMELDL
ncbi:MAG: GNAT family N-acetyltransferase [Armatimonas sp.]